jgi:hypothetical protein
MRVMSHNPKVAGSNPAPAMEKGPGIGTLLKLKAPQTRGFRVEKVPAAAGRYSKLPWSQTPTRSSIRNHRVDVDRATPCQGRLHPAQSDRPANRPTASAPVRCVPPQSGQCAGQGSCRHATGTGSWGTRPGSPAASRCLPGNPEDIRFPLLGLRLGKPPGVEGTCLVSCAGPGTAGVTTITICL